jgi:hypothetical protein
VAHVEFLGAAEFDMLLQSGSFKVFCAVFGNIGEVGVGEFGVVNSD